MVIVVTIDSPGVVVGSSTNGAEGVIMPKDFVDSVALRTGILGGSEG